LVSNLRRLAEEFHVVGGPVVPASSTHIITFPPKYVAPNLDRLLKNTSTLSMAAHTSWTPQFALGHRLAGSTHTKKALTPDTEKQWSEVAKRYIERHVLEIWRGVDIT
jgi:hypothetical protein